MATIQKFEALICWQKARELTQGVYKALRECRAYGFKDQIQRAAVSVMSNIAEGFERGTQQEFVNYLLLPRGRLARCGRNFTRRLMLDISILKHLNI